MVGDVTCLPLRGALYAREMTALHVASPLRKVFEAAATAKALLPPGGGMDDTLGQSEPVRQFAAKGERAESIQ